MRSLVVITIHYLLRWDHGGRNSYRMGAEGKFDLKVVSGGSTGVTGTMGGGATVASGAAGEGARGGRKSHSTPSLPDATAVDHQVLFIPRQEY